MPLPEKKKTHEHAHTQCMRSSRGRRPVDADTATSIMPVDDAGGDDRKSIRLIRGALWRAREQFCVFGRFVYVAESYQCTIFVHVTLHQLLTSAHTHTRAVSLFKFSGESRTHNIYISVRARTLFDLKSNRFFFSAVCSPNRNRQKLPTTGTYTHEISPAPAQTNAIHTHRAHKSARPARFSPASPYAIASPFRPNPNRKRSAANIIIIPLTLQSAHPPQIHSPP